MEGGMNRMMAAGDVLGRNQILCDEFYPNWWIVEITAMV
jgi:hypothetical protein